MSEFCSNAAASLSARPALHTSLPDDFKVADPNRGRFSAHKSAPAFAYFGQPGRSSTLCGR
jgi:hypothetical protein